jgi:hypothetical protein
VSRLSIIAVFCIAFAGNAAAASEQCQDLANGIRVSFPRGFPESIQADTEVTIPIKLKVTSRELLDPFRSVPVWILVSNGQLGSNRFNDSFFLKQTTSSGVSYEEDFQMVINFRENAFGLYKVDAELAFSDSEDGICSAKILNIPDDIMTVLNDPERADTNAPIVTSVTTDRSEYRMGGLVTLSFTALDKSTLCTEDLIQQGTCEGVGHVAMIETNSGTEIGVYPSTNPGPNGTYLITFHVLEEDGFKPGEYKILGINVYDIWGNGFHPLRQSIHHTFRIESVK